jgi:hypothetical protein
MKKENEQKTLIKDLKKIIKKNSEIIVIIHSVSRSGTQRKMSAFVIYKKQLINLNCYIEKLEIAKCDKNQKLIIKGCGMDMAFHLCYKIKCKLFGYKKAINNQQYKAIY